MSVGEDMEPAPDASDGGQPIGGQPIVHQPIVHQPTIHQPTIQLKLADRYDLGGDFFRWEFATAVAGALIGVHPFDQPDVQSAKDRTDRVLENRETAAGSPVSGTVADLLAQAGSGDYLAILVYGRETPKLNGGLGRLRALVTKRWGIPATVGYGPRYLHSTGQLHKGGPNSGLYLLLTGGTGAGLGDSGLRVFLWNVESSPVDGGLPGAARSGPAGGAAGFGAGSHSRGQGNDGWFGWIRGTLGDSSPKPPESRKSFRRTGIDTGRGGVTVMRQDLGYQQDLFILPFDHRGSFEAGLAGIRDGRVTPEQLRELSAFKRIIYDGYLEAVAGGAVPIRHFRHSGRPTVRRGNPRRCPRPGHHRLHLHGKERAGGV